MTPDAAHNLQRQFTDGGKWTMWLVSCDMAEIGKAVARAVAADGVNGD